MARNSVTSGGAPKSSAMDAKRLHDQLLAEKPEGATHSRETCDLCSATNTPEGGTHVKTYTEEEMQAALEEHTSELQARLDELESAARASEVETQVEAARAEAQAEIAEIRSQLDNAVLEAQAAKAELESVKSYLAEEAEKAARESEIASRREERLAKVKEVASFPEEYLEANAERFAAMSDEDFAEKVAEWAMLSAKAPHTDGIPSKTALTAAREVAGGADPKGKGLVREMLNGILTGVDPRSL